MRNDEDRVIAGAATEPEATRAAHQDDPTRLPVRGAAGGLRPYRDVRAAFEPWRRLALLAWSSPDDAMTAH